MIDLTIFKSILCLNGYLPSPSFFKGDLPIIAADGAANNLMKIGIIPDVAVGDLDSLEPQYKKQLKTHYYYDQNLCDYEKSLLYLEKQQLIPTIVTGINGGALDHILNNINIFIKTGNLLYAPPLWGYTLRAQEKKIFELSPNTKISIFGIPEVVISTQGLKWNLSQQHLSFPGNSSISNKSVKEKIVLEIHKGVGLILVYENQPILS